MLDSIKANEGHTEGAAGVMGLVKLGQVQHTGREVQRSHLLDDGKVNPLIDEATPPLRINRAMEEAPVGRRVGGGVSSFGFGGTNAHAVLRVHTTCTRRGSVNLGRSLAVWCGGCSR